MQKWEQKLKHKNNRNCGKKNTPQYMPQRSVKSITIVTRELR